MSTDASTHDTPTPSGAVVAALDGSHRDAAVIDWAAAEAAALSAPLHLVHAVDLGTPLSAYGELLTSPEIVDRVEQESTRVVVDARAHVESTHPGLPVSTALPTGSPSGALMASAQGARVLVVGSARKNRAERIVLGTTSMSVVAHAPCPVVLVPENASTKGDGRVVVGTTDSKARDRLDHRVWITSLRAGAAVAIVGFLGTAFTGHAQAQQMIEFQPTKMASAEAACHDGTAFSVLTLGDLGAGDRTTCTDVTTVIELPGLLSYLAYEDFTTPVPGLNSLLPDFEERYGTHLPDDPLYGERAGAPIDYQPLMEVTYWGFRLMITFGGLGALAGALTLWMTRRGTVPDSRGWTATAVASIGAPFAANVAGWVFTEMGRQPFVVYPNPAMGVDEVYMFTAAAVSPGVSAQEVLASLIVLVGIYAVLLVVEVVLMVRYVRGGVPAGMPELTADEHRDPDDDRHDRDDVLAFAY